MECFEICLYYNSRYSMNRITIFISITIFSIFVGSQITEGCLLVPYWQSLDADEFYQYYINFGPAINGFYTILTIASVLISVGTSVFCYFRKSPAFRFSLVSSVFALLIIVLFYAYFKGINQQFYQSAFQEDELSAVLKTWKLLHWIRVAIELVSFGFLLKAFDILHGERNLEATS